MHESCEGGGEETRGEGRGGEWGGQEKGKEEEMKETKTEKAERRETEGRREETGSKGAREKNQGEEWAGRGGGRGPSGVPAPLRVIKDIDVLRRQRVFAQVKGNPKLVMAPSAPPPCPLPAQAEPWEAAGTGRRDPQG